MKLYNQHNNNKQHNTTINTHKHFSLDISVFSTTQIMIYFTLPQSPPNIFHNIKIETRPEFPPVFISQSLCSYINNIKEQISYREKEWDFYKKYTNPYEYIHSIVPMKKKSVSKYKPISRSYFKMLEMISVFKLDQPASSSIRTFHLAEGPGGFIEAICNKRNNMTDEYYGMTIIIDEMDDNVPAWNKTGYFLSQHPNINIEYGIDGTGNLLHINNFEHCVHKYGSSMDFITADGGFDFSNDFNRQEISITNLLWGQVCYALCLQKQGGNFVLKIFDIFYEHTVHILYILSAFYEEVHVCKLKTSRVGNSEKYVVCKHFRFTSYLEFYRVIHESFQSVFLSDMTSVLNHLSLHSLSSKTPADEYAANCESSMQNCLNSTHIWEVLREMNPHNKNGAMMQMQRAFYSPKTGQDTRVEYKAYVHIWRLLSCNIPRIFTKQVEEINAIFGQQQIENIHYTISLIDKNPKQDKLDQLVKQNIPKCMKWCIDHSLAYNNLMNTNLFEGGCGGNKSNKSSFDSLEKIHQVS